MNKIKRLQLVYGMSDSKQQDDKHVFGIRINCGKPTQIQEPIELMK